jgi:hypothetical protein
MNRQLFPRAACPLLILFGVALLTGTVGADPKDPDKKGASKPRGTVSGIMTDFKNDFLLVQLDDQDEPTKFLYGPGITQKALANRHIFPIDRVNLKYKTEGDDKQVVAIEKVPGKPTDVIVGKVIKVYNNFWVSVKPDHGMIEGFALNGSPEKTRPASDILKSLNPGDLVAIKYATDFERHRILQIDVKSAPAK